MSKSAPISAKTLLDVARHRARLHPQKLAFDYCRFPPDGEQHTQLTYLELDAKARAIAATLQLQGVAGERVLVLCPSGVDFVAAFFGCTYAGAAAIPVHPPVRSRVVGRVASILRDVDASFVLATAASQSELKSAVDDLADGNSLRWCAVDDVSVDTAAEWVAPDLDPNTIALLQYTSGSTSTPKGVMVTHANLLHNLETIARACGDDSGVFWLPLHHDMGLIGGVLETLYLGGSSYFMPPEAFIERPMRWLEAMSRHRATTTTAPNFAYELCIEHSTSEERAALDLSNWRTAMCGAEPVRAATLDRFADAFACAGFRPETFHAVYGLAEATLLVTGGSNSVVPVVRHVDGTAMREHRVVDVAPEHTAATQFVGCGRTHNGQELVIADPESRQPCGVGEVGEIWLSGGGVAAGYWGRPEETERTFQAFLSDGRGPFLRTGDLGFQLDDELFVTGRLKDLVIIRGRNYYPEDIEANVQDSHPGLLRGRGACFSVTPDSGSDEELVVVQEVDRGLIGEADVSEVIDAIRTSITEHHEIRPYAVVLVELLQIPTTSSGKIRRNKCRESFLEGELQVFARWRAPAPDTQPANATANLPSARGHRAEEISTWLVSQLSRELDLVPTEVDTAVPFAHYGLDSLHAIRLTAALSAWLGRELSPTLAYEYPTIELAAKHLAGDENVDARHIDPAPTGGPALVPARTDSAQEPIAIIGIGCRFPGADGPAAFWQLLSEGTDAVTEVSADRWGAQAFEGPGVDNPANRWAGFLDQVDQFDAEFFSISPRESARMDPQQRLLLEVAWEAMEDAGQVPEALEGSRTGVFVGISTNEYGLLQFGDLAHVDPYTGTGSALSIAANRLSYVHDFRGPSMAIDTACSSSLVAIHLACRSLSDGDCTLALAGGVNVVLSPKLSVNFFQAGVMAADGKCKTFDAKADGYVRGEGAGIVVLKPLNQALAEGDPIYSVIRGSATNQDGRTNGLMAPSRQSQEAVLTEAYRRADLSPGLVQYVEAHGTGTSLGDAIEAKALGAVVAQGRAGDSTCLVGSVKTNIGHLEAAAGVAGLIKVALAMHHRMIPPSLNFTEPNPNIPFDDLPLRVAQDLTPWPEHGGRALAGVSSFGFGGANAHVVLAEAPQARAVPPADDTAALRVELLPLSARSPEALNALAARYETALQGGTPLAELCYTASARRGHHVHRLAAIGDSAAAMSATLSAYRRGIAHPGLSAGRRQPGRRPGPVFVFSGQGSQWCGMGQQLYAQEPAFRDALAMCDEAIRPHLDSSVVAELLAEDNDSWLTDIGVVQPAIFAVQAAQAALWRSWGIEPEAVIGHSLGEVSAAYVAGALTLTDAARVICARARLLRRPVCRGAMVVAELTPAEARDLISGHEREVAVAAANSHRSTVLSGDPHVLTDLVGLLEQRSRFCRWIKVDVASHGPQMEALRSDLKGALAGLAPTAASIPMYSTVTGDVVASALDAAYWVENLCSPVQFSTATRQLLEAGHDLFLEVSPHPILLSAVREDADDMGRDCTLLPSMRSDDGGRATPLASLGSLYSHGQPVAWEQLYPWGGRCVAAPTYPWQRRHFWTDATETTAVTTASDAPAPPASFDRLPWRLPLHSAADPQTTFCEIELSTELMPVLSDHRVHGAVVVPAATLLKLVLSAAAATFGPAKRVLRDVDFSQALLLADAEQRTVQIVLHQDAWGAARFECFSLESDAAAAPGSPRWSLLASGAVAADEADRPDGERRPPELIAASCPDVITGSAFYRRLAEHGLQYGPSFAAVEQLWRRDGEAVARLTPPDANHDDSDGRTLDASFQVLAATLATSGSARDTYLPVGVTELRTHETPAGGAWCHALLRPASEPEPDTIEGDVFLLRDDGRVAMSARGLRLRRIPGDQPTTTNELRDNVFEVRWQSAAPAPPEDPAALGSAPLGSWLIFSDGSATSHTLRAHLERHAQSCVIVEPGAEFERRGPLEYRLDPAQPKHFRRLLEDVFGPDRRPCHGVVHLWSLLAAAPSETSTDWLNSAQVSGAVSVLHLTQALTLASWSDPPRLWLVTNGTQVVDAHDASVTVAAAPLWGMGRSIALEHPELRCTRVDLPAQPGPDEISALAGELWADGSEADVALRGTSRYVARLLPRDHTGAPARRRAPGPEAAFRMEYPQAGVLDDVRAVAATRPSPRADEVELRVHAAGLNFIDAMRALGVYPGQVDGGPVRVGIECAGIITAVGDCVKDEADLHVGDAVVALAMDGVGSFVTTPACLVAAKPTQLSFEAAAALPIAYLTAYYSLHEQARLRRGEHVLIHSGAGGVGLAAVQVARWLGATVYATAGTAEKRDHLHALGVEHVFDSRSLAFADEVLAATGGKGVDVVLNSLTGEAIAKGLAVLRPSGRFVEIGKRDIYGHGSLRLWQLRHNASYLVVDLAALVVDRPDYVGDLLRRVAAGIAQGAWAPPPVRTFPVADTAAAVRCLAQGKQIGKVVVSLEAGAVPAVDAEALPVECPVEFEADATYLITGGLGGLGRAVATWLVERGARNLVLMGRTPASTSAQQTLDALRKAGAHVVVARGDVARADQVASVIESIRVSMPPLRGVVHTAGVLDDGIVAQLDQRRLRDVMAPKVDGAWNLHALTRDADLDFFVLFSSAASVLGSPGQAHYAAANSFLDALAWYRRAEGRSALSINWGPWAEVGLVAKPEQLRQLGRHGIGPMSVVDGVAALSQLLRADATQAAVLDIDWARWRSGLPQGVELPLLADLVPVHGASAARDERKPATSLGDELRQAAPTQRRQLLESYLRDQAAAKLGLAPERLVVESPLNNLGVDSLIATELRTQIERDLGVSLPVIELLDGPSITTLAGRLDGRLSDQGPAPGRVLDPVDADIRPTPVPEVPAPDDSARWIDLLAKVPEVSDADVDVLLRELLAAKEVDSDG